MFGTGRLIIDWVLVARLVFICSGLMNYYFTNSVYGEWSCIAGTAFWNINQGSLQFETSEHQASYNLKLTFEDVDIVEFWSKFISESLYPFKILAVTVLTICGPLT